MPEGVVWVDQDQKSNATGYYNSRPAPGLHHWPPRFLETLSPLLPCVYQLCDLGQAKVGPPNLKLRGILLVVPVPITHPTYIYCSGSEK